ASDAFRTTVKTIHWTVDTQPPKVEISGPSPHVNDRKASFTVRMGWDTTLACSLNNTPFSCTGTIFSAICIWGPLGGTLPCRVEFETPELTDGTYNLVVTASDGVNPVVTANYGWRVDNVGPTVSLQG